MSIRKALDGTAPMPPFRHRHRFYRGANELGTPVQGVSYLMSPTFRNDDMPLPHLISRRTTANRSITTSMY